MPDITISSPDTHGKTTIGVNGITREVKHNTRTNVSEAELEVLQNGELGTGKLVTHDDETDEAASATSTVDEAMKAGTEASHIQAPATPATTSDSANRLAEGAGGESAGGDKVGGDDEIGGKPAGSTDEGGSEGGEDEKGGDSFDAHAFLDKSMREIDVASVSDKSQIDALIAAEQKRQDPRSTLLEKLEARKAQIG